jgi:acyl carrier protein
MEKMKLERHLFIEQCLLEDPAIKQARVLDLSASDEEAQWAVAISLAKSDDMEQSDSSVVKRVRKMLLRKLRSSDDKTPVPKKWFVLDLPLDASGHVDEEELLRHLISINTNSTGLSMLEKLREIVSQILRMPLVNVSPSTSFIRLGGDSITAIELMSRLLAEKINLRVPDILRCDSLTELASLASSVDNHSNPANGGRSAVNDILVASTRHISDYWNAPEGWFDPKNRTSHQVEIPGKAAELLLNGSHSVSRATLVDVSMAAILDSFQKTFSERETIAALVIGSVREVLDPVVIEQPLSRNEDFTTAVRRTKDSLAYGLSYYGENLKQDISFVELLVHYIDERNLTTPESESETTNRLNGGVSGHANSPNGHANGYANGHANGHANGYANGHAKDHANGDAKDHANVPVRKAGQSTIELKSLFNIKITLRSQNRVTTEFDYPQNIKRYSDISKWAEKFFAVLESGIPLLVQSGPIYSLSDFPHLPLSYPELERVINAINEFGYDTIDNIYPSSSVQEGILVSQIRSPELYRINCIIELYNWKSPKPLSLDHLEDAWRDVVAHNWALRTVFTSSPRDGAMFDQIVLKNVHPDIMRLGSFKDESMAMEAFRSLQNVQFSKNRPAHRLAICDTADGRVFCKLEISHAIIDGMSGAIIFRDICLAYGGHLPHTRSSDLGDFISFLQTQTQQKEASLKYWIHFLNDMKPCYFPSFVDQTTEPARMKSLPIEVGSINLKSFCSTRGVTVAILFQAVWGIVLRGYTLEEDVCFGYLTSGRDIPIAGIDKMIGPLINMLVCRITFESLKTFEDLLFSLKSQLGYAMDNQYISLAEIQHSVAPGEHQLFNSIISMMNAISAEPDAETELDAKLLSSYAPTEVRSR